MNIGSVAIHMLAVVCLIFLGLAMNMQLVPALCCLPVMFVLMLLSKVDRWIF